MQMLELMQKLTPGDKEKFDRAFASLRMPLAEHSFSWIRLWEGTYKDIEWTLINGNLCLFLTFEGQRCAWGPALPGNELADTVRKCFSICESHTAAHGLQKNPAIRYIPDELKQEYSLLEGFELREQFRDYLYLVKDIISLSGRKYADKRNKRNFFVKKHEYKAESYDRNKHQSGCLDLLERWKAQKVPPVRKEDREKFEADMEANRKILGRAEEFGIRGVVVTVEGKIEGYIFGERTNSRICTMLFGKTNLNIKGLSQFIYGEFLKQNFEECELVNDGEDWGVAYLEKSKLSYNPRMVRKSYMLQRKNGL